MPGTTLALRLSLAMLEKAVCKPRLKTSTVSEQELRSSCLISYIGDHPMDGDHSRDDDCPGIVTNLEQVIIKVIGMVIGRMTIQGW